jgi:hypothetical protein
MPNDQTVTPWTKSSYSNTGANCVETARTRSGAVAVRDSQSPGSRMLVIARRDWEGFVSAIKDGSLTPP